MKTNKILLIGSLNRKGNPLGGEEYKNRVIANYLSKNFSLKIIDTHKWKLNYKIPFLLTYHILFYRYDKIIISASSLSSYRLIKILNNFPVKLSKTIYFVIGGYFPAGVVSGRYKSQYYLGLNAIIVEGNNMKKTLEENGLANNIYVMPNFKPLPRIFQKQVIVNDKIRFLCLSSISLPKGVGIIFEAVNKLIEEGIYNFTIDFWGPIESPYSTTFLDKISNYSNYCTYKGYLDILNNPENAYNTLGKYDCMLFPTYFEGEGFPGVVIDAYIAGLSIIGSDWNMNSEVINHGKTGLIIPPKNPIELALSMRLIIENPEMLRIMKKNSKAEAEKYDSEKVLTNQLLKIINK
jgi:glycosyltransferase involved in cell wall biosynthesis